MIPSTRYITVAFVPVVVPISICAAVEVTRHSSPAESRHSFIVRVVGFGDEEIDDAYIVTKEIDATNRAVLIGNPISRLIPFVGSYSSWIPVDPAVVCASVMLIIFALASTVSRTQIYQKKRGARTEEAGPLQGCPSEEGREVTTPRIKF